MQGTALSIMHCMVEGSAGATARSTQWLRGVLDVCLLAVIADEPAYGYEMTRRLANAGLATVADGSIYPALARLERAGLVESYRVDSPEGPARKYYRQTQRGFQEYIEARAAWSAFAASVARVLGSERTAHHTDGGHQ